MKMKIAIIDDDRGACLLITRMLEKTNQFRVVSTTDSKGAQDFCAKEKPDFVILDNVMPGIKGSELVKMLKKNKVTKDTPIIMLTGKGEMVYSDEKENFEWKPNAEMVKKRGELEEQKNPRSIKDAYGVNEYISKPVTPSVLLGAIESILIKKKEAEDLDEWKKYNT